MKMSLNKKLLISFILVILISLLITGIISTYMIDRRFNLYLLREHEEKVNIIKSSISSALEKNPKNPDFEEEGLTRYAVLEGYVIEIFDMDNNLLYTTGMQSIMGRRGNGHMRGPMMGRMFRNMFEAYNEDIHPIILDGKEIGSITIGYLGASNISREAMSFKLTLYSSILISSLIAVLVSVFISIIISRQLGIPIKKIIQASRKIREGNLSIRTDVKTNINELSELSYSINNLANTLQKQESLRHRLTSDMAHEIRTPLTTIKSHIEAFIDNIWEPTPDRLKDCCDEVNRLHSLVENLEDINKLEEMNYVLNKSEFHIDEELDKIATSLLPQFNKKNIKLQLDSSAKLTVFLDQNKFKQIMYNLLSNAFKYSYVGGVVDLKSHVEDNHLYIIVRDYGIGIPSTDIPHIFEHLYRGDSSRARVTGGSGIGLAITKTLVEAHGGKIMVESRVDEGSAFTIEFPLDKIVID